MPHIARLFNPGDLDNVKPMSAFLGQAALMAVDAVRTFIGKVETVYAQFKSYADAPKELWSRR